MQAEANSVKPMASGAMFPCPGLVTAVAYTTWTKHADALQMAYFMFYLAWEHPGQEVDRR